MNDEENQSGSPSQAGLGRALGLSKSAITKLKGQGMPVDSVEAAQAWREKRQSAAARKPLPATFPQLRPAIDTAYPDEGEDRDSARARREIAEADLAEMAAAKMRRELIRVSAVQATLAKTFSETRDSLLQIGARLGPAVAGESDPGVCSNLIEQEVIYCLQRLCNAAGEVPDTPGGFD